MFRSPFDTIRVPVAEPKSDVSGHNCDMCGEGGWPSEADVDIHMKKAHTNAIKHLIRNKKSICTICYRPQRNKTALIRHIKTNHLLTPEHSTRIQREVFICHYCKRLFLNKKLLTAHIQYSHIMDRNNRKEYSVMTIECPICLRDVLARNLWYHFLHHDIIVPSACPICLQFFDTTKLMVEHSKTHPGYYFCDICMYNTNKEQYFRNHLLKHRKTVFTDGKRDLNLKKYFVPGSFDLPNNLKLLKQSKGIQMSGALQICVLCREMCDSEEGMRQHILGDHAPEREDSPRTHECACGEVFFNSVLLKHHVFKLKGQHRISDKPEEPETDLILNEDLGIAEEMI